MTLATAIEGCKKQDRKSQKFLFDAYSEAMLMLCLRYVRDLNDAEELMLNGFFNFYKHIGRFSYIGDGSISAYLKKVMVNECLMFLRKKGGLLLVNEGVAEDLAAKSDAIAGIAASEILKLLTSLPDGYRTVFNLYAVEGYNHQEIAKMLDISEGTSKSQLSKARAMLQILVKQNGCYYEQ